MSESLFCGEKKFCGSYGSDRKKWGVIKRLNRWSEEIEIYDFEFWLNRLKINFCLVFT